MLDNKKVVAFICECNPFHEGHKRLIYSAKNEGDILIAVMSGNYVQRGEFAVYDKYYRAKKLLQNGVSLVIELPVEYTLSSAKYFATYSVAILNKLKFVDKLIFGSKINNIDTLTKYAEKMGMGLNIFNTNQSNTIHKYLKMGFSYSYALSKTYDKKLSSNDILAIEYISAIKQLKSKITPISIKRINDIPTASELRKTIDANITNDDLSAILNYKLLLAKNSILDLSDTYLMTDDLCNAILNTADQNLTFTKRAKLLKTKNRTLASIKRALLNLTLGIKKDNVATSNFKTLPQYIRILGVKNSFLKYLKDIDVPYLLSYNNKSFKSLTKNFPSSKAIKTNKNGELILSPSISLNIFASDLYNLLSNSKSSEATTKALII